MRTVCNAGNAKYDRGDIDDLGKAYDKALAWAKKVSQASNTSDGNVWKKSNSDNKQHYNHHLVQDSLVLSNYKKVYLFQNKHNK